MRHGVGSLKALLPSAKPTAPVKGFKAYELGYAHIDVKYLPQMADEDSRSYLFVAVKTAASARAFLKALCKACAIRISKILTDNNGRALTDRLFASRERQPNGDHQFDQLCKDPGIGHRLATPGTPQTNGMAERFNG